MKYCYHPGYHLTLPAQAGGAPPISKLPLLYERLLGEGIVTSGDMLVPEPIDLETLELVHTREYLGKLESNALNVAEQRRLGIPWSESLWLRSRLASGGTLLAARTALQDGLAGNLAGGSHHAFPDHGEGFCVLNDVAVAIAALRVEGSIGRAAVVDLDVHQGNGTAVIFENTEEVYTFGERNYPTAKMRSTLDVGLADGADDDQYLGALEKHLPVVLTSAEPDIVFYVAGVDVAAGDRYGKLALSEEGIRLRERMVIRAIRSRSIPLCIVLGGGYAATRARTAELHAHVFREAAAFERLVGESRSPDQRSP
jgi:acetoin utilization deacetylase AcuC-like enzyme